jgi:DNA-directed RNA polymerase subunit RPC12/RpoP
VALALGAGDVLTVLRFLDGDLDEHQLDDEILGELYAILDDAGYWSVPEVWLPPTTVSARSGSPSDRWTTTGGTSERPDCSRRSDRRQTDRVFITYRCNECDNPTQYEVDLNLDGKDMTCPTCGHRIAQGDLPGGEWRSVYPDAAGGTGTAYNPTVTTKDGDPRAV